MTTTTNFHKITTARADTLEASRKFDVVGIGDGARNIVNLFLPEGTGQAVADAINAAVAKGGE